MLGVGDYVSIPQEGLGKIKVIGPGDNISVSIIKNGKTVVCSENELEPVPPRKRATLCGNRAG